MVDQNCFLRDVWGVKEKIFVNISTKTIEIRFSMFITYFKTQNIRNTCFIRSIQNAQMSLIFYKKKYTKSK